MPTMLLSGLKTRDREWGGGVERAVVSVVVRCFGLVHAGTGRTVVMRLIVESTMGINNGRGVWPLTTWGEKNKDVSFFLLLDRTLDRRLQAAQPSPLSPRYIRVGVILLWRTI